MSPQVDVAIIGAGPYGLSLAAYLRSLGLSFRIIGRPMQSWLEQMPKGMLLKSEGFASNLYDPAAAYPLGKFCAEKGIPYADEGLPVSLETFGAYGLAFKDKIVPELENKTVVGLERTADGFLLRMDDGQTASARRVVLAVGITHFQFVPESLAHLPAEFFAHSSQHHDLQKFRDCSVVVVGGGSSAIDMAALLHQAGAKVQLVARRPALKFHGRPETRSLWKKIRHPQSGLGPGVRSWLCAYAPHLFRFLPQSLRTKIVRRHLGPSGGWFSKDQVMGRFPLHLGCDPVGARVHEGKVHLEIHRLDGGPRELVADYLIAATGYKPDLRRLKFLSDDLRGQMKQFEHAPNLSGDFETSIPGLYMVGPAAANSFGPLMRFAFGAGFAAQAVSRALHKTSRRQKSPVLVGGRTAQTVKG